MIKYETIIRAKAGDERAVDKILEYYLEKIKKISKDDEFVQAAIIKVYKSINKFENKKV